MNAILQNQSESKEIVNHPVLAQKTTMQAIVQDRYGSSSVLKLRSIDKPEIGADEVLVRVRAAGVHIGDLHVMTGQPYPMAPSPRSRAFAIQARSSQTRR